MKTLNTFKFNATIASYRRASDADVGANAAIRYAIIGGNTQMQFSIDSLSGDVSLVKALDYEQVRSYRLVIRAQGELHALKLRIE